MSAVGAFFINGILHILSNPGELLRKELCLTLLLYVTITTRIITTILTKEINYIGLIQIHTIRESVVGIILSHTSPKTKTTSPK